MPIVLPHIVIKLKMWEGNCKRSQSLISLHLLIMGLWYLWSQSIHLLTNLLS